MSKQKGPEDGYYRCGDCRFIDRNKLNPEQGYAGCRVSGHFWYPMKRHPCLFFQGAADKSESMGDPDAILGPNIFEV